MSDGPTRSAASFLAWLAPFPPELRDAAVDEQLGFGAAPPPTAPGDDLVGYHPSGVASIVRSLLEVPVGPGDTLIDLGAGLGKVMLLASLLTEARVRGIEIQPALVQKARAAAAALGLPIDLSVGDVRVAPLDDGTVFYLYVPLMGAALAAVLERLREVATRHPIVICALGIDLGAVDWLVRRNLDHFWLEIYDSVAAQAESRPRRSPHPWPREAELIALERPCDY